MGKILTMPEGGRGAGKEIPAYQKPEAEKVALVDHKGTVSSYENNAIGPGIQDELGADSDDYLLEIFSEYSAEDLESRVHFLDLNSDDDIEIILSCDGIVFVPRGSNAFLLQSLRSQALYSDNYNLTAVVISSIPNLSTLKKWIESKSAVAK